MEAAAKLPPYSTGLEGGAALGGVSGWSSPRCFMVRVNEAMRYCAKKRVTYIR